MNTLSQLSTSLAGRYDIEREIGRGGMATVYLARDVRHDRHVALKVLNPDLGAVLGVDRFLAEIKVTANLQHPNLLPLFDSGEAGGLLFYVMPYVEGESLRARLEREKQLPVDEALRIAVAVASALDYAHAHGVIHRDLKPENILLQAGQPMIADFGIALAVSNAGGNRITQTGLSLGTPQYMSPEQATGDRVIDGRSDIYSLAAMTYEMLAGEPPHIGNTAQAIIARVLTDRPRAIRTTRAAVPDYVEAALAHGLEKLPADRFSTARQFAEALQGRGAPVAAAGTATGIATVVTPAVSSPRRRLRDPVVLGLGAVALAAVVTLLVMARGPSAPAATQAVRFVVAAPDSARPYDNYPWPAAISPDGGVVVYSVIVGGTATFYALRTDQLDAHPVPGTSGAAQPFFSPDGRWLAFEAGGKLRKVRLDGSAPITISDGGSYNGGDWTIDDEIVLGAEGSAHGLSHVSAAGGERVEFTAPDSARGQTDHLWPIALSDGKTIVFTVWSGSLASAVLGMTALNDGKVTILDVKGIRPLAVLDGTLVYVQADGSVMAIPIDPSHNRVTGRPVPVLEPVTVIGGLNGNSGIFVSRGGALITSRGGTRSQLSWFGRSGAMQPASRETRGFVGPRLSPDGRRIAVTASDHQNTDIWIYDMPTATLSRLTSLSTAYSPEWTADGRRVVFIGAQRDGRPAILWQPADGGAPSEVLYEPPDVASDVVISPDGNSLLYTAYHNNTWDIFRVPLDSTRAARPFLSSRADETEPRFSRDGRWVAVSSDESGQAEVYLRSFPDPAARVQVSAGGGNEPVWSADGTRLYYRAGTALMQATLSPSPTMRVMARDTVFSSQRIQAAPTLYANYDVTHDGTRFIALVTDNDDYQLIVVPNWLSELQQRLKGAGNR